MVRYADDFVCCFQYESDAQMFYESLKERLAKFKLEVAEDKTKILPFGRYAVNECKGMGQNKPPTFDFFGFTHYCSKSQSSDFRVKRRTSKKKERAKLQQCKEWLMKHRHDGMVTIVAYLNRSLRGYYNYYCITDNIPTVDNFQDIIKKMLFKWMNRRSQRRGIQLGQFSLFMKRYPLIRPTVKPRSCSKLYSVRYRRSRVRENRKHGSRRGVEHNLAGKGSPLLDLTQFA